MHVFVMQTHKLGQKTIAAIHHTFTSTRRDDDERGITLLASHEGPHGAESSEGLIMFPDGKFTTRGRVNRKGYIVTVGGRSCLPPGYTRPQGWIYSVKCNWRCSQGAAHEKLRTVCMCAINLYCLALFD